MGTLCINLMVLVLLNWLLKITIASCYRMHAPSLQKKKKSKTQIVKQNKPLAYMIKSTVLHVKGTFWEPF